mgnify:CR=1 FL=1
MGKAGRPPAKNPRQHVLSIRMSEEEWTALRACAAANESTMTDIAREAVVSKCKKLNRKLGAR